MVPSILIATKKSLKNIIKKHIPTGMFLVLKFLYQKYNDLHLTLLYIFARSYVNERSAIKHILKENWENYKIALFPKNRKMRVLEEENVYGMNTENIRFIINAIVSKFAINGVYLEVGIYQGCSLLSAALFNLSTRCIGIDNFSEFDQDCENEKRLKENLEKFKNIRNVEYYNIDYRKCIKYLFSRDQKLRVDVYYYDGEHSYENQLEGLRIILPHLAERCVILVDDINWDEVEKANKDFLRKYPDFKLAFRIRTKGNKSKDWWNGFEVITRGI